MSGAGLRKAIPILPPKIHRSSEGSLPPPLAEPLPRRSCRDGPGSAEGPAGREDGGEPSRGARSRFPSALRFSASPSGSPRLVTSAPAHRPLSHAHTESHTRRHTHTHALAWRVPPAHRKGSPGEKGGKTPTRQPPVPFVALFLGTIKVKLIDSYY